MNSMKPISTRLHGIIDFVYSFTLLFAPRIFGFSYHKTPSFIARLFGGGALALSLMTQYEWGLVKVIPMRMHLVLDVITTALLAASPFLFGFKHRRRNAWMPHLVIGLLSLPIPFFSEGQVKSVIARTQPNGAAHDVRINEVVP